MDFQMRGRTKGLWRVTGCVLLVQLTGCGFFGPKPIPTDSMKAVAEGIAVDEKYELYLRHQEGRFPDSTCVFAKWSGKEIAVFVYPEEIEPPVGMKRLEHKIKDDGELLIRTETEYPAQWVLNGEEHLGGMSIVRANKTQENSSGRVARP